MAEESTTCDVLVVGGGPAGLMAAIAAAEAGAETVLVERNSAAGIKLMMTGKGRCNLTHAENDKRIFLQAFGRSGKFLFSAFNAFGPEETIRYFEERGLPTKVERGGRVFPVSDQAADVRCVLETELKRRKVKMLLDTRVTELIGKDGHITGVRTDGKVRKIDCKDIIVATGGLSYPGTGSTGDGFAWARELGHNIVAEKPALTPIILREECVRELEGLSLKNVRVSVWAGGKKQDERFGEALFTERGLSGPIILDMSKSIGELLEDGEVKIRIDYKPALEFSVLDERVQRDLAANAKRMLRNSLDELLPQKLIPVIIKLSGIAAEKKANEVTKEERKRLLHLLKEMEFTADQLFGFDKAVVTAGGIDIREVDPRTMRSEIVDNLYFAGEVLDLDAPTGGYNLQEAWSTGRLAGSSAAKAR